MVHCVDGVGFSGVIATAGDKHRRVCSPTEQAIGSDA